MQIPVTAFSCQEHAYTFVKQAECIIEGVSVTKAGPSKMADKLGLMRFGDRPVPTPQLKQIIEWVLGEMLTIPSDNPSTTWVEGVLPRACALAKAQEAGAHYTESTAQRFEQIADHWALPRAQPDTAYFYYKGTRHCLQILPTAANLLWRLQLCAVRIANEVAHLAADPSHLDELIDLVGELHEELTLGPALTPRIEALLRLR